MENIKISHHQDDTVGEEILQLVADCVWCGSVKAERTLRKAFQERRLLSCCHLLGHEFSEGDTEQPVQCIYWRRICRNQKGIFLKRHSRERLWYVVVLKSAFRFIFSMYLANYMVFCGNR